MTESACQQLVEKMYPRLLVQPLGTVEPAAVLLEQQPALAFLAKVRDELVQLLLECDDVDIKWTTHRERGGRLDVAFDFFFHVSGNRTAVLASLIPTDRADFASFTNAMRKGSRILIFVMDKHCAVRKAGVVEWRLDRRSALSVLEVGRRLGITSGR